jgi:hypothetical protein
MKSLHERRDAYKKEQSSPYHVPEIPEYSGSEEQDKAIGREKKFLLVVGVCVIIQTVIRLFEIIGVYL